MNYYDEHWENEYNHYKKWKDDYPKKKHKDDCHSWKHPRKKKEDKDENVVVADQNNTNTTNQYAFAEANGGNADAAINAAMFAAERIVNVAVGGDADAVAVNRNKTCQTNNAQSGDDNDARTCINKDKK
ncbi:hypothetical protein [Bacillus chungangensis]|uniref:Uncharacterized protein n=1 Tax=Bacillus chungangensis TaxID=587633 RepID=A0ABT9WSG9_9BACI|nr:hypothetical protein [Bacillus chungangensis]MDQ0176131.1 hypothetical protein [Bacillus chungangensis]